MATPDGGSSTPDMGSSMPEYMSGSRLRVQTVQTADGANGFYSWYDSQLATDCYSAAVSDGSTRCVPWTSLGTSTRYSDTNCQSLLAEAYCARGPTPKFASEYGAGCVGEQFHPVLGVYSGPRFYGSSGQCSSDPTSSTSYTYFNIGAKLAPSAFVGAPPPAQSPPYGRLIRLTTTFADGAFEAGAWHDTKLDMDCWFNTAGDGSERCLPSSWGATGQFFADASCTTMLGSISSCDASTVRFVADSSRTSFYEVTGPHAGSVWQKNGTQCTPYSGTTAVALDVKPVSLSDFVAATLGVDATQSGTRIQRRMTTSADGARQPRSWYDAQLGVECGFSIAGDGKLRCMPTDLASVDEFRADIGCKQPLAWGTRDGFKYAYGVQENANCATTPPTYYQLGALYSGTVYLASGTSCSKYDSPPAGLYTLGSAIPVTTFVEGTLTTQ
jgi:hypothetical protein